MHGENMKLISEV